MISSTYIRSSALRTKFNALLASDPKFSKWESDLTAKRALTYHDERGNVYTNAMVEPHFALTSELQYYIVKDGQRLPSWWDVCDILIGYWIYNLTTGKTYTSATAAECSAFIRSIDSSLDDWKIQVSLSEFSQHASDIQYGAYLFQPSSLIGIVGGGNNVQKKSSSMMGLALAAGLTATAYALYKKR